jgi:hypothetical protein
MRCVDYYVQPHPTPANWIVATSLPYSQGMPPFYCAFDVRSHHLNKAALLIHVPLPIVGSVYIPVLYVIFCCRLAMSRHIRDRPQDSIVEQYVFHFYLIKLPFAAIIVDIAINLVLAGCHVLRYSQTNAKGHWIYLLLIICKMIITIRSVDKHKMANINYSSTYEIRSDTRWLRYRFPA